MKKIILLFFYITLVIIVLRLTTDTLPFKENGKFFRWDHENYIKMARSGIIPGKMFCNNPFCYRIFIPMLVSFFPTNLQMAIFTIITYLGIYLTLFSFYFFLKLLSFSDNLSFLGINLFFFSRFGPKFLIFDNFRPEALSIFFIIMCFISILKRKDLLFSIFFICAVLTKEQTVSMILVFYAYNAKKMFDFQAFRKTIVIGLLPAIIFFGIRYIFPSFNPDYNFKYYFRLRIFEEKGMGIFLALSSTLGIVFYIAMIHFKKVADFFYQHIFLIPYLFFQIMILLFAGNDLERFALYLFPVLVPAVLYSIKKYNIINLLILFVMQIVFSGSFVFYTINGLTTLQDERRYLDNFAFYMQKSLVARELVKSSLYGIITFCAIKIFRLIDKKND